MLRAPVWQDGALKPVKQPKLLDFAVIWDEDHDERVIEVIESLYFEGLLTPVSFIGERKGSLSIMLNVDVVMSWSEALWLRYRESVNEIGPCDDPWPATVGAGLAGHNTIIHAHAGEVATYLSHIELLWRLGLKPVTEHVSRSFAERMAEQIEGEDRSGGGERCAQ